MIRSLYDHYPVLTGTIVALLLIFWPPPSQAGHEARRKARLAELDAGAEEAYFEERRALETYGPSSGGPFRIWGILLLLLSLSLLVL